MKTTLTAAVLLLSLIVLPGCTEKSTPGGGSAADQKRPLTGENEGTFELTVPGSVPWATSVKQGESTPVTIGITRGKNFDQDVALSFSELPTGVTVDPAGASIKKSDPDAKLTLKANDEATVGTFTVKVIGTPGKGKASPHELKITVSKKADKAAVSISVPTLSTHVQQGASKEVSISAKGIKEDVTLKFDSLPPGVTVDPANPIAKNGEEVKVNVKATPEAGLGDKTIKVIAHPATGTDFEQDLKVTIEKK